MSTLGMTDDNLTTIARATLRPDGLKLDRHVSGGESYLSGYLNYLIGCVLYKLSYWPKRKDDCIFAYSFMIMMKMKGDSLE